MTKSTIFEDLFNLTSEVAIVTGGLGQLGAEYAKILAEAGATVAIFDVKDSSSSKVEGLINLEFT